MGASVVGLMEAISLLVGVAAGEYDPLFWGPLVYGVLGGLGGFFWGGCALLLQAKFTMPSTVLWRWSFLWAVCVCWYVVFQNIVYLLLCVPLFWWLLGVLLEKTPFRVLQTIKGSFGISGILFSVLWVFSLTPSRNVFVPPKHLYPPPKPVNVLVLVADGVGGDFLRYNSTASLLHFSKKSVIFTHAYSNVPDRFQGWSSMLTGTLVETPSPLSDTVTNLAEQLSLHGYYSFALVNDISLGRFSNMHQGFDRYRYLPPLQDSGRNGWQTIFDFNEGTRRLRALDWILGHIASAEPHPDRMYRSVDDMVVQLQREVEQVPSDRPWFAVLQLQEVSEPLFVQEQDTYMIANTTQREIAYQQRLRRLDMGLGKLFSWLQGRYADNTIVVFTSTMNSVATPLDTDFRHVSEKKFAPASVSVPLWLSYPYASPKIVSSNVQLIDIPKTIVNLVGIPEADGWKGDMMLRLPVVNDDRTIVSSVQDRMGRHLWVHRGQYLYYKNGRTEALYDMSAFQANSNRENTQYQRIEQPETQRWVLEEAKEYVH